MNRRFSQIIISIASILMVFSMLVPTQPVYAQLTVTNPTGDIARESIYLREQAKLTAGEAVWASLLGSLVHGASFFMRKVAYDTAVYISSGGRGQSGLIFQDGFGTYLGRTAQDAAADAIGEFGRPFGLNLCQIPDLRVNLFIQIGLDSLYGSGGPTPNCSFQQLRNNWSREAFESRYGDSAGDFLAETFSTSLNVQQTDFGIALGALAQVDRIQGQRREEASLDRQEGDGFKPLTDLITGNIKTPAQTIRKESESLTATKQSDRTLSQISGVYGAGAKEILPQAASVFLNTLTSRLLQQALTRGLFPTNRGGSQQSSQDSADFFASRIQTNRELAREAFGFLIAEVPTLPQQPFDTVTEFATCPSFPSIHNCVIDENFRQALVRSRLEPITLQQAVDEGLLNGNWPIISPRRPENETLDCYERGFCYSNIQKLRKLRILPLGFEIAAANADPDNPPTLNEVMDRFFTDCVPLENDPTRVDPNRSGAFCRLIDPNWVLRAPVARCELRGTGEMFASAQTGERLDTCFDISTCVDENDDGTCDGTYGYCTKEENIWRLPGQVCDANFASCQTLTNVVTGKVDSYLTRTLDANACTENSVGCRAYSLVQSAGEWIDSTVDRTAGIIRGETQAVYFNQAIVDASAVCNETNQGCSAFVSGIQDVEGVYTRDAETGDFLQDENTLVYAQKAPDYLGCYDIDAQTPGNQFPESAQQATNEVSQNPLCANYASICVENEVGCEAFDPVTNQNGTYVVTGPTVPGKIGDGQLCNEQCVGYDSFRQLETVFDDAEFPMHFIPDQARSCPARYVGCEEFTSLEDLSEGGENREYYTDVAHCETPDDAPNNSFVMWEGSIREGFVIRRLNLVVTSDDDVQYYESLQTLQENDDAINSLRPGSPKYSADTEAELIEATQLCNEEVYTQLIENPRGTDGDNLDCRALFDNDDNVYYRLVSKTVQSTEQCRSLRRTNTVLAVDEAVTAIEAGERVQGALCQSRGGFFDVDSGECLRCKNGGVYENGSCIYKTSATQASALSCRGPETDPDAFAGCRVYTGNNANNVEQLLPTGFDSFEPASEEPNALVEARAGWQPSEQLSIVAEATHLGLNSMQVRVTEIFRDIPTSTLSVGNLYTVTLWSRGEGQQLTVDFVDENENSLSNERIVGIDSVWQAYTIGPFDFDPNADFSNVRLRIRSSANEPRYFIDNVSVTRGADLTVVRHSWREQNGGLDVPQACDANPNDGLPGSALGCRAYQAQTTGRLHFATGFEQLCRADAVGCAPVWDTFNTVATNFEEAERMHLFNVYCPYDDSYGPGDVSCTLFINDVQSDFSCTIPDGDDGCVIPGPVVVDDVTDIDFFETHINESTIVIPADTPANDPIFLALKPEHTCDADEVGCQLAGQETQQNQDVADPSIQHSETFIKNDPALYADTLCTNGEVGCTVFSDGEGEIIAKDPAIIGGRCLYRPDRNAQGQYGWFLEGEDNTPCYPDLQGAGGEFPVLSNGTDGYNGLVGMCPGAQNDCRELIDPLDADPQNPAGRAYYRIFNEELLTGVEECNEGYSQKEGCILFDDTSNPNKLYDAQASLVASATNVEEPFGLVPPAITNNNNTNLLLRVERDRQCREWLSCKTYVTERLPNGQQQRLCYQYEKCIEAEGGICTKWQTIDNFDFERLTRDRYLERDVSWTGEEYSGYSLFNKYGLDSFAGFLSLDDSDQTYLAHEAAAEQFTGDFAGLSCLGKQNGDVCGFDDGGRCQDLACLYPVGGTIPNSGNVDIKNYLTQSQCKSYPEISSPREITNEELAQPELVLETELDLGSRRDLDGFVCQSGNCSCEYKKVTYENGQEDYWPLTESRIPPGICSNGGSPCRLDIDCSITSGDRIVEQGQCSDIDKIEQFIGIQGYCLEYDLSREIPGAPGEHPCLTWHPIGVSASKVDVYNANVEAGYTPTIDAVQADGRQRGGSLYCTASAGLGSQPFDPELFAEFPVSVGAFSKCGVASPYRVSEDRITPSFRLQDIYGSGSITFPSPELHQADSPDLRFFNPRYSVSLYKLKTNPFLLTTGGSPERGGNVSLATIPESARYNICGLRGGFPQNRNFADDYTEMQMWSWQELSRSAFVLRMEGIPGDLYLNTTGVRGERARAALSKQRNRRNEWREMIPYRKCGENGDYCVPFHFFPVPPSAGDENDSEESPFSSLGYGTLMHPPRLWEDLEQIRTYYVQGVAANNAQELYSYLQTDENSDRRIAPIFLSPENQLLDMSSSFRKVSQFEEELHISDLAKVHFVPVGYPSGAQGTYPAYLTKDFYIDFLALDRSEDNAFGRTTEALVVGNRNQNGYGYINPNRTPQGGFLYNYVLEADSENGLVSFDSYAGMEGVQGSAIEGIGDINGLQDKNFALDERNAIHKRYVAVFFPNKPNVQRERYPNFVSAIPGNNSFTPPSSLRDDPFSVPCSSVDDFYQHNSNVSGVPEDTEAPGNWFAIGMDFNKDGEFLGYIVRHCEGSDHDRRFSGGLQLSTVAILNDQCVEAVQVYDEAGKNPLRERTNYALTGRVTKNSEFNLTSDFIGGRAFASEISDANTPFGSLTGMFTSDDELNASTMESANFAYRDFSGLPYSCRPDFVWKGLRRAPNDRQTCSALYQNRSGVQRYNADRLGVMAEVRFENDGSEISDSTDYRQARLQDIFAGIYRVARYGVSGFEFFEGDEQQDIDNPNLNLAAATELFNEYTNQNRGIEFTNQVNELNFHAPYVYALNTYTCDPNNETGERCTVGETDNITINGRNGSVSDFNRDGVMDEDFNQDGQPDPIIAVGNFEADMKFFAFVDSNHMPMRQVLIDWQDGSKVVNVDRQGLYKNRKPLCDYSPETRGRCSNNPELSCGSEIDCPFNPRLPFLSTSNGGYQDTWTNNEAPDIGVCQTNPDEYFAYDNGVANTDINFGSSARACTEGYFEFTHTYTCDAIDLLNDNVSTEVRFLPANIRPLVLNRGLAPSDRVCSYKPRVQIRDNMGWCNGSCGAVRDGLETRNLSATLFPVYDENGLIVEGDGIFGTETVTRAQYEGCYDRTPSRFEILNRCSNPDLNDLAWTEYNGEIIVIPQ